MDRYIKPLIIKDLERRKMVLIAGPRQVGKTTLALGLLAPGASEDHPGYKNWDRGTARKELLRGELPSDQPRVVLDEIHKFARWRNLLKGFYDTEKSKRQFIVTGSARLDYYRRGGDSLQGRYHLYRLHPFSPREMTSNPTRSDIESLIQFGGFPEPLFSGDQALWRRWQLERVRHVLYDDLRDLERVREISLIELLVENLPQRVGSPLSVKNLAELLEVSFATAERWISMLERLYFCFRISPYGAPKIKAVKKERKLYLWDWSTCEDPGARFENMVASQLLKYCHWVEDTEGFTMELRFIRDVQRHEVDFVVLKNRKPIFAVETKTGERSVSRSCHYFRERTPIPKFYQVHLGEKEFGDEETGVRVLPFHRLCSLLELP